MKYLALFMVLPQLVWAECVGRVEFDGLGFDVEIAADAASRAQGLMHRETMLDDAGMLFVYGEDAQLSFWMKNTPLPLDILFYDRSGHLQNAASGRPYSEALLPGFGSLVLEVNAGVFEQNSDAMRVIERIRILEGSECPDALSDWIAQR